MAPAPVASRHPVGKYGRPAPRVPPLAPEAGGPQPAAPPSGDRRRRRADGAARHCYSHLWRIALSGEVLAGLDTRLDTPPFSAYRHPISRIARSDRTNSLSRRTLSDTYRTHDPTCRTHDPTCRTHEPTCRTTDATCRTRCAFSVTSAPSAVDLSIARPSSFSVLRGAMCQGDDDRREAEVRRVGITRATSSQPLTSPALGKLVSV